MKPSSPSPKKRLPRLLLLALLVVLLAGAGWFFGKDLFRAGDPGSALATAAPDKEEDAAWRKANPWLYTRAEYEPFRDALILPLARAGALGPRSVKKRGALVEVSFPAGRPIHEYAYEVESLCARAGLVVVEGRETGNDQVEYRLADAQGRSLALRLVLGDNALPGSVRMALVIIGLGNASEEDLQAWLEFGEAVTLVLPDTSALLARFKAREPELRHDIFVELPMEPSTYPYVKPGPRALFIDHSRDQAEGILRGRLEAYPKARGFATTHGDRAIENPQLMESVLDFMASRSLVFLDLTGSPLSQTTALSQKSGAESFSARAQVPGSEGNLEAELDRRAALAQKSGEGIWVLRHSPGLPRTLARLFGRRAGAFGELGLLWAPLGELRRGK
ncbi:MAG: protein of unknown function YibQ [Fibrobacteria bacterium]|jgi:polysaccharide deacetylase 2 family uncharacterized protein YibQ|nr:protein of unknown function YibQ [Fibrobacteria bacterium]